MTRRTYLNTKHKLRTVFSPRGEQEYNARMLTTVGRAREGGRAMEPWSGELIQIGKELECRAIEPGFDSVGISEPLT